jgi:ATP-dependent helicase/nuclease subunit B
MPTAKSSPVRVNVHTIPFGFDLSDETVSLILNNGGDPAISAAETIVFLPSNRAIKSMTEAFVRRASPGLLLPRMVAIGDLALDEAVGPLLDPLTTETPLWPAIDSLNRLLLIAALVVDHRPRGQEISATEALRLARKLAELIDELEIEEIPFAQFNDISVNAELAGHWQKSYGQLLDILPQYYDRLSQLELLGPSERRNKLLQRLDDRLKVPWPGKIIAAGITTSAPAVVRVLSRIAKLPNGLVILPGVDKEMALEHWDALRPSDPDDPASKVNRNHEAHPQFHLKLLLDRMGTSRDEIEIAAVDPDSAHNLRIADIFCLPSDTTTWRALPESRKVMPNVTLLETSDSSEEARAIAIAMRGALETQGQRTALVTPDRELAMRVAVQLKRWGINVDDSAGMPVLQTPPGKLIMAIADAASDNFSPVSILAIAKHPLVRAGENRIEWLEQARALDIVLRGPPEGTGLAAIGTAIASKTGAKEALPRWWQEFSAILAQMEADGPTLADCMSSIQSVAEALTDGNIWKGAAGRQLALFWEEAGACDLTAIGKVERAAVPALLTELAGNTVVRPPYGGHPRLAIYGLLEARLQQADFIICAGLNEMTWPQIAQPDPWLAPAIRRHLGLATLDRNIGLSAHDLAMALGGRRVLLTRARRDRGGPTVASRFILRMKAFLGDAFSRDMVHRRLATAIDSPIQKKAFAQRPEPRPDARQRRVTLTVTDFDQLKSDPYSFYARRILGLRVLDAVNADPGYAWRGTLVHEILEQWFRDDNCAPDALQARAQSLLTNTALDPILRALWQPRIAAGLHWIAQETMRLQTGGRRLLVAEKTGSLELLGVNIKGRADRIDCLPDGSLVIIDYKTGVPPKPKQLNAGFALQLGLIGLMAENGTIETVSGKACRFEYWSLAKNKDRGFGFVAVPNVTKSNDKFGEPEDFLAFIQAQAEAAISDWIVGDAPFVAKLHPDFTNYSDYDHLMRLQEWDGRQPLDEGDLLG